MKESLAECENRGGAARIFCAVKRCGKARTEVFQRRVPSYSTHQSDADLDATRFNALRKMVRRVRRTLRNYGTTELAFGTSIGQNCQGMSHRAGSRSAKKQARRKFRFQVFVSHATADKWIAKTLCTFIEQAGAETFRDDRDINGGDNIPNEIRTALRQSKEMVVLITPLSFDRNWVKTEVGAAWGWRRDYRITAFLYHTGPDKLPPVIANDKALNLNDVDQYLSQLKKRISAARKEHRERA